MAGRKTSRKLKVIKVLVLLTAVITHNYTLNNYRRNEGKIISQP